MFPVLFILFMEAPLYIDPVTREAPTRPLVLTLCGHSIDQSYLDTLEERARRLKASAGYCCLVCEQVSPAAVRNFALETMLGLVAIEGPARIEPVQSDRLKPLCNLPEFAELSKTLGTALTTARDHLFAEYQKGCKFIFECVVEILNGKYAEDSCWRLSKLTHFFPTPTSVVDFLKFGNERYKTEFLESHRFRIRVLLRRYNAELTYKNKGWWNYYLCSSTTGMWYSNCTDAEFLAAPAEHRGLSISYKLVD
jgi:hypothetical protein